ncbi:MAG: hypothetical protein ABI651_05490 [Verrucomicrobiota bacterium]
MKRVLGSLFVLCLAIQSYAAPFQNLGFDEAITNRLSPADPPFHDGLGTSIDLLPGWQLFLGTNPVSAVGMNWKVPGFGFASLYNQAYNQDVPRWFEGLYLGLLPGQDTGSNVIEAPFSLVQTGDIPADAASIHFLSYNQRPELKLNNAVLPVTYNYFAPGPAAPVFEGVADVSAFAGQTVELEFTTPTSFLFHGLDSISFSPQIIPEPGPRMLFGLGGAALWAMFKLRMRPQIT